MSERATPTIDDCAREPIHLAGAIQPHGYLVACTPSDWIVQHVSANIDALFDEPAAQLLGRSLRGLIAHDVLRLISDTVGSSDGGGTAQLVGAVNVGHLANVCDITAHLADGLLHIEIEPQPFRMRDSTSVAQAMIATAGATEQPAHLYQRTADQIRLLTGFERVMIYRFRPDDSGDVIAESCSNDLEPYLGHRFPASDIPPQARALYLRNRLRTIPDVGYVPVPVLPAFDATGKPLDMSQHVLRSVSPVHLEYLHNMGVAASMSISIISNNRLWGLIACHNRTPRPVAAGVRAEADLFGLFVSMRVAVREDKDTMARYESAQQLRDALAQQLAGADDVSAALVAQLELLGRALDSDGAALWLGGQWHARGRAPASGDPGPLLDWVQRQGTPPVAMTNRAADWVVPALQAAGLGGLMAINLGGADDWLFLFRAEQIEHVRWAGKPHKALELTDDGVRIAPRKSFETWRQTVRGQSLGWTDSDHRGAERLQRLLREQLRHVSGLSGDPWISRPPVHASGPSDSTQR